MSKTEIKRVRESHKLMSRELARRLGVSPARISVLEREEQKGAVTLKMMERAAAALDCEFVYALVPRNNKPAAKPRLKLQQQESSDQLDSRLRALLEVEST